MKLSIVIPVFNEADSLLELAQSIETTLNLRPQVSSEVLFVDDGSTDGSQEVLRTIESQFDRVRVIELTRNYGQTAAMYAGFQESIGETIIPLDADGQNDPADIWRLSDRLDEGFDCVSGWRKNRQDKGISRRLPSFIANRLLAKTTRVTIHDSGCTIKSYNGNLLRTIPLYGEMHRLVPFYIYLAGGKITELEVAHHPRVHGKSKYGISRTFRVIQDILVARVQADFASRPMHLFGNIGAGVAGLGVLSFLIAISLKLTIPLDFVETPLPIVGTLFILGGLQIAISGLTTEILVRQYRLGNSQRTYRIKE